PSRRLQRSHADGHARRRRDGTCARRRADEEGRRAGCHGVPRDRRFRAGPQSRLTRRDSMKLLRWTVAAAFAMAAASAVAQGYPSKPVRMIVGFPPGGGTDVVARVISAKLQEWYGQAVLVENRPGATGTIGADAVAKSAADGYTLIMGHVNSHGIAPNLFAKLPYDAIKDFAAVAYVGYVPNVLAVHPSVQAKNVKELIALAKAKPGAMNYASSGNGSTQHLAGEMFKQLTGTD